MPARSRVLLEPSEAPKTLLTPTAGEVFPDASVLELVRGPSAPARPALLHWDGRQATVAAEIVVGGYQYVPPEIDPKVWRCVEVCKGPTTVGPFAVYAEIRKQFGRQRGSGREIEPPLPSARA